jgi:hypothetical protein
MRRTHARFEDLSHQFVRHRVRFQPPHRPRSGLHLLARSAIERSRISSLSVGSKIRFAVRAERERVRTGDGANKQIHPSLQVGGVAGGLRDQRFPHRSDRVDRDASGVSISRQLAAISLSVHIWITGGQQDRYIARGRGVCGSAGANGALPRRGKPHRLNRSAKLW